jgi:hypothetical protein
MDMKANRFTEEQIIGILREQEAGAKTAEVCRVMQRVASPREVANQRIARAIKFRAKRLNLDASHRHHCSSHVIVRLTYAGKGVITITQLKNLPSRND